MDAVIFLARDYEDQETTHKHLAAESRNRYVYNIFTVPWDFMNIRALIELLPPSYLVGVQTVQASDSPLKFQPVDAPGFR